MRVLLLLMALLEGEGGSTPYDALGRLKEGHSRFLAGTPIYPHSGLDRVRETGNRGQRPFAAVLTCSDSRIAPEHIFDQGLGDLVVVRVEGNVCSTHEMASLEYALTQFEVPFILVLGHTQCGAIGAAVTGSDVSGHLAGLVDQLREPVAEARRRDPKASPRELSAAAVPLNVYAGMKRLLQESPLIRQRLAEGKSSLFGAVYEVADGRMDWLGAHPDQDRLLLMDPVPTTRAAGKAQVPGPSSQGAVGKLAPVLAGLLLLCSGVVLGVGLAKRAGAPKAA